MVDYYCIWCGGYLYEELDKTGKYKYEVAKRVGCGRPNCNPDQSIQKKLIP